MPRGTRHEVEGMLLRDHRGDTVLRVDDGGTWRLDLSGSAEPMLGRRVIAVGTRAGFDLLDLQSIAFAGDERAGKRK